MREVRDTFLHFLSDNLTTVPVNYIVRDPSDAGRGQHYQTNALNVEFLSENPRVGIGSFKVSLDLIYESELALIDAMSPVFQLLSASGMAPLTDYSQTDPVPLGGMVFWDVCVISFKKLYTDNYSRRNCVLTLQTHVS